MKKLVGNMTNQEKKMNKDDLLAYKMFDNNQYSMIPGISNKKLKLDRNEWHKRTQNPESPPLKKILTLDQEHQRLKEMGYGRDVTEINRSTIVESTGG
jgi:hypothetical protein